MNIKSQIFANDDSHGNRLYMRVFFDENNQFTNATIYLKLKSEENRRQLGNMDFITHTFYCKRSTAKHYHRQMKGFGFNWTVLSDTLLNIKKIHLVVDDNEEYLFDCSLIKEYGKFLNFKQQGFELQKFMPLSLIKNFRINKPVEDEQESE
jgi:hypothetical protein